MFTEARSSENGEASDGAFVPPAVRHRNILTRPKPELLSESRSSPNTKSRNCMSRKP